MSLNNSYVTGSSIGVQPRKIPGPASKTVGRFQQAGGGAGERGGVEGVSQVPPKEPTRSSSVSLAELKRSQSTETETMSSVSQSRSSMMQAPQKTTCLLCSDPVILPNDDADAAKERNEVIKTLCFHMQMTPKEVPGKCTAEMFPFCTVCERLVRHLWENEKIIQESQKRISKNIAVIERTVADAELLRATMRMSSGVSGEDRKFVKLRDTILDGYRTKLVMRQKLRENLILGTELKIKQPVYSHTVILEDKSLRSQFLANRAAPLPPAVSTSLQNSSTHENITVNVSPMDLGLVLSASLSTSSEEVEQGQAEPDADVGANNSTNASSETATSRLPIPQPQPTPPPVTPQPPPISSASSQPQQPQMNSRPVQQPQNVRRPGRPARPRPLAVAGTAVPAAPGIVGRYNENSCSMVISNVRSDTDSPTGGSTPTHPVMIKQEPVDSTLSPTPIVAGKRKRRTLFQGIEIAKLTDTRTGRRHFQCTICKYTIPGSISPTGLSPYQSMSQHITEKHLSKKRKAALVSNHAPSASANPAPPHKKRMFTCKLCAKTFTNLKALLDHKTSHIPAKSPASTSQAESSRATRRSTNQYYIENLECDVCGRPVKGNLTNLLAHKFSHKNNEERQAALAAREKGSRNALLRSDQARGGRKRGPIPKPKPLSLTAKRYRRGKSKTFGAQTARSAAAVARLLKEKAAGPFKCQICARTFSRSCHLALHMGGHARRNKLPVPLSKAKQKAIAMRQPILKQQPETDQAETEEYSSSREEEDGSPEQFESNEQEDEHLPLASDSLPGQVSNEEEMGLEDGHGAQSLEANDSAAAVNAAI